MRPMDLLERLWNERSGASTVEYALILGLIVLAMLGALGALSKVNSDLWGDVSGKSAEAIAAAQGG